MVGWIRKIDLREQVYREATFENPSLVIQEPKDRHTATKTTHRHKDVSRAKVCSTRMLETSLFIRWSVWQSNVSVQFKIPCPVTHVYSNCHKRSESSGQCVSGRVYSNYARCPFIFLSFYSQWRPITNISLWNRTVKEQMLVPNEKKKKAFDFLFSWRLSCLSSLMTVVHLVSINFRQRMNPYSKAGSWRTKSNGKCEVSLRGALKNLCKCWFFTYFKSIYSQHQENC